MDPRFRGDDKEAASIFILRCGKKIAHSGIAGQLLE
jgi:hypothetical protein